MPKFFHTITLHLSEKELRDSYSEYKEIAKMNGDPIISYKAFLNAPDLHTYVDMKCLNCHFEIREHFGEYHLDMQDFMTPFPVDVCPNCGFTHLVPKDIYNKLTLNVLK